MRSAPSQRQCRCESSYLLYIYNVISGYMVKTSLSDHVGLLTIPWQRAMKDKVANVFLASISLFQSLVRHSLEFGQYTSYH